jgi:hypothetical protein
MLGMRGQWQGRKGARALLLPGQTAMLGFGLNESLTEAVTQQLGARGLSKAKQSDYAQKASIMHRNTLGGIEQVNAAVRNDY